MNVIKVPYTRIERASCPSIIKYKNQPLLTVGLKRGDGMPIRTKAYIDTGAQVCLFNGAYAKMLGVQNYKNSKEVIPMTGIGGKKPENTAYFHDISLIIYKNQNKPTMEDAYIIETKIGFLDKEIQFAGILGVYGFLDHFSFLANIPEHYFELTPCFED